MAEPESDPGAAQAALPISLPGACARAALLLGHRIALLARVGEIDPALLETDYARLSAAWGRAMLAHCGHRGDQG